MRVGVRVRVFVRDIVTVRERADVGVFVGVGEADPTCRTPFVTVAVVTVCDRVAVTVCDRVAVTVCDRVAVTVCDRVAVTVCERVAVTVCERVAVTV